MCGNTQMWQISGATTESRDATLLKWYPIEQTTILLIQNHLYFTGTKEESPEAGINKRFNMESFNSKRLILHCN